MPDINLHEGYSHDAASYDVDQLLVRFQRAKDRRSHWEGHWQECYEFALPQREGAIANRNPGEKKAHAFMTPLPATRSISLPPVCYLN